MHLNIKKTIYVVLVLNLWLCFSLPVNASNTPSNWARSEVETAINAGIVPQKLQTDYQAFVTREEYAEVMVLIYENIRRKNLALPSHSPFIDTDNPAVAQAYAIGIISGVTPKTFAPSRPITRQEICVMLHRLALAAIPAEKYRFAEYMGNKPSSAGIKFADEADFASWAYNGIIYANKIGVIYGTSSNLMNPLGPATREQAVMMAARINDFMEEVVQIVTNKYVVEAQAVEIHSMQEWRQFLYPTDHFYTRVSVVLRDEDFQGDISFVKYSELLQLAKNRVNEPLAIHLGVPWWYLTSPSYKDYGVFVAFTSPVSFYYNDSGYVLAAYKDTSFYDQLNDDQKQLYTVAVKLVNSIMSGTVSDYERIKRVHDYLVLHTEYDTSLQEQSYTEYGPLLKGQAVCQGYATAMQLLLTMMKIENKIIIGECIDKQNGGYQPHSWNLVKLDGNYFHIDATWDDPIGTAPSFIGYDYFLKSDAALSGDHIWNRTDYPACNFDY